MSKPKSFLARFKKSRYVILAMSLCATSVLLALGAYFFVNWQSNNQEKFAQAAGTVNMYKGETRRFTVTYKNEGDQTTANGIVRIYVGNKTTLDTASIRERFDTDADGDLNDETEYCITPNVVSTDPLVVFNWGYLISYRPRSATTTATPCNGQSTVGATTIPVNSAGSVSFNLTLRTDISDAVGAVLSTAGNQGVKAEVELDGRAGVGDETGVTIVSNPNTLGTASAITGKIGDPFPTITLTGNNVPTGTLVDFRPAGCTTSIAGSITTTNQWSPISGSTIPACVSIGGQTGTLVARTYPVPNISVSTNFSNPDPIIIAQTNIGTATCSPDPVVIAQTTTCTFPLSGNPTYNDYSIPTVGIQAAISTNGNASTDLTPVSSGYSPACTVINNQTAQASLRCASVPTTGGTVGLRNVLVRIGTATPIDKGDVTLQNQLENTILITQDRLSYSVSKVSSFKYGTQNLNLTVSPDTRFNQNETSAECRFRVKEYGVANTNTTSGYGAYTTKLVANAGGAYNTTTGSFNVPYSTTSGCSVRLPSTNQNQPKWTFEIKVIRSDNQVFETEDNYFMLYGAVGTVTISAGTSLVQSTSQGAYPTNTTQTSTQSLLPAAFTSATNYIYITPDKMTYSPVKTSAAKFGTQNLLITLSGDTRFTNNGATTAVCRFRIKEYGVADGDTAKGYSITQNKLSAVTGAGGGGSYNTTSSAFQVPYDNTAGCKVQLLSTVQNTPKWEIEVEVLRNSDSRLFGRNEGYFMLYGAVGTITIS